ncbi:MAG: hypothetical protein AAGJ40_21955 [Planctomycetota bacterium]
MTTEVPAADGASDSPGPQHGRWVEFEFECLPLRSVTRLDVPLDASPAYEEFVLAVNAAVAKHGGHNAYFLHHGKCKFHLTNDPTKGRIEFSIRGVVLTDLTDTKTKGVDLEIQLGRETCPWLNEPSVEFLIESVKHAVAVEFDRYIHAGDLEKAKDRLKAIEDQVDQSGGFQAMYL